MRLLPLMEQEKGATHEATVEITERLAMSIYRQKRYDQAGQLLRRVIEIRRTALGDKNALVARAVTELANVLWEQGRKDEAKALFSQGLAALPAPRNMPPIDQGTENASAHLEQRANELLGKGRLVEAEAIYLGQLDANRRRGLAGTSADLSALEALIAINLRRGRDKEAEAFLQQFIEIRRKESTEARILASDFTRLARLFESQNHLAVEVELLQAATEVREKALGSNHPETAAGMADLARSFERQGKFAESLATFQKVAAVEQARLVATSALQNRSVSLLEFGGFKGAVRTAFALSRKNLSELTTLSALAFEAAQWAEESKAGLALAQLSERYGVGATPLARLIRALQDKQQEWQSLDRNLIEALGATSANRSEARIAELRKRIASVDQDIASLRATLEHDQPRYAALTSQRSLSLTSARRLMGPDETSFICAE